MNRIKDRTVPKF
jgi:hypothetical protein